MAALTVSANPGSMTDFPHHRTRSRTLSLSRVTEALDAKLVGIGDPEVRGVTPVADAGPDAIGFLASRGYLEEARASRAAAFLVSAELAEALADDGRPRLVVQDAHAALEGVLELFHEPVRMGADGIHPSAVVSETADLHADVSVGPLAVVEEGAVIGAGSRIGAHVVVGAGVTMGRDCQVLPHATLYPGAVLGDRVIIHSGARVGVDGFGYVPTSNGLRKVPQVGRCVLGDDVEVGANTTLDRGSIGDTRIGAGVKIDNLVQIGHNVRVGDHTVIAAQVGVAGSTRIGSGVQIGGQAGIGGHLKIGDGARLAGQAGVTGDVEPGTTVMGFPARPRTEYLRAAAAPRRVPDLIRKVRALEARISQDPSTEATEGKGT